MKFVSLRLSFDEILILHMGVLKNASNDCFYFVLCNIKVSLKNMNTTIENV